MSHPVSTDDMVKLAKRLRLQAYYDTGDPDGSSEGRSEVVREARNSALTTIADTIDETFSVDSKLTQDDLEGWRR